MAKTGPKGNLLPNTVGPSNAGPVECLGMTFESDDARRAHFLARLKEKLPELRQRHDFPIGENEDILGLSDPPYYTACPNPFLTEFVKHHGKPYDPDEPYHREPFAVDVSVGKTDPLYKAHGYHTKVPHKAIVPSILHYTEPGDIVLDGFCGSGMTGVAAQWCGTAPPEYRMELEQQWEKEGRDPPKWGARRAILGDLSPAATFIAANYNIPFDLDAFAEAAQKLLDEVEEEVGWMYETLHTDGKTNGRINYTVWSQCFTCPECTGDIDFVKVAIESATGKTRNSFPCPYCSKTLTKKDLDRLFENTRDAASGDLSKRIRLKPMLIDYTVDNIRHTKTPDDFDISTISHISELALPPEVPTNPFPINTMAHGSRLAPKGITHVHHIFLNRALHALAAMWRCVSRHRDRRLQNALIFLVEQAVTTMSLLNRYRANQGSQSNQVLSGVYYVPSQVAEISPWYRFNRKVDAIPRSFKLLPALSNSATISTSDCADSTIPTSFVDYVFVDPPFGENIFYADLNHLVESWHRIRTQTSSEAIIDKFKGKTFTDYKRLMQSCFEEYYRVLKPGRWMTVVFHNSRNSVWSAIQEAMLAAKFVVADVRVLDKGQRSYRQITSNAVKRDLVISAYKPNSGLEERFGLAAGTEDSVWEFIRTHLRQLPIFVSKADAIEAVAERQDYLLFDRMVAFHVLRGITVPLSAAEFHEALSQRFAHRDRMYFLPDQVVKYDQQRAKARQIIQLDLFVKDEETAIQWLRQQLDKRPQSFQDIHPSYISELGGWAKHEKTLELSTLLKENFLHYNGRGEVPAQLHAYLSTNFRDLRKLPKDALTLRMKAKGRWYVPDPRSAGDLEKRREQALLREFKEYQDSEQRRLRVFRLEAIRAGFHRAWQAKDYATIVSVAAKIPDNVLQEDPKLLMWFDQATIRVEATQ